MTFKTTLPWLIAAVLAAVLVAVLARDGDRGKSAAVAERGISSTPAAGSESGRKVLYWIDPMHPAYKSDKPGIAPDCGMDLVPVYADEGTPAAASSVEGYSSRRSAR